MQTSLSTSRSLLLACALVFFLESELASQPLSPSSSVATKTPSAIPKAPTSAAAPRGGSGAPTKTPEQRKLDLEIKNLQQQINTSRLDPWLQTLPVVIALFAASVSFWSAWRTLKSHARTLEQQIQQQQKDRISELLKELGNTNLGVRISAIQSLSDFPETHRFLVNLLKYEHDPHLIDSVIASLQRAPKDAIPLLARASVSVYGQMRICAGRLVSCGVGRQEAANLVQTNLQSFNQWLDTNAGKRVAGDFDARMNLLELTDKRTPEERVAELKSQTLQRFYKLTAAQRAVVGCAEAVFDAAIKASLQLIIEDAHLPGIVLDHLDLSEWEFRRCNLQDGSFREAKLKRAKFQDCRCDRASFRSAGLHDCRFERCSCVGTKFTTSTLARATLESCNASHSEFIGAKAKRARFVETNCDQARLHRFIGIETDWRKS